MERAPIAFTGGGLLDPVVHVTSSAANIVIAAWAAGTLAAFIIGSAPVAYASLTYVPWHRNCRKALPALKISRRRGS